MADELHWYENPETGAVFGFGLPLPDAIADQIKARKLRPCDPPADAVPVSPETDPEPKADGTGEDDGDTDTATDGPAEPAPDHEVLQELGGTFEPVPKPHRNRRTH